MHGGAEVTTVLVLMKYNVLYLGLMFSQIADPLCWVRLADLGKDMTLIMYLVAQFRFRRCDQYNLCTELMLCKIVSVCEACLSAQGQKLYLIEQSMCL